MKHRNVLRELAKIGVGLFIADLVSVLWFGSAGFFPLTILGVTWTASAILPIAAFDLALIILLSHYAWRTRVPASPRERTLLYVVGLVFLVVCLVHLARLAFGWTIILENVEAPLWLSWFGAIGAGYLSYASFHFGARAK